jgi:hypothetical protein
VRNIQVSLGLSKGVGKNEAEGLTNVLLCKKVLLRSPVVGKVDDQLEESTQISSYSIKKSRFVGKTINPGIESSNSV